ncbi:DEAD/DEAH box RNA helicase [Penicillium taxi]|uniref:DEAD/DEAH box RNA helicase n=1 Tax=Penicillium taxi TaxID=168475 RepID=UPI00254508B9|nr:DEAD/DEAH box RNA helicase [Penicillium taxi]KAJ5885076.1 DEAD/DEAH box RNA helicase [Penicillium taxi]
MSSDVAYSDGPPENYDMFVDAQAGDIQAADILAADILAGHFQTGDDLACTTYGGNDPGGDVQNGDEDLKPPQQRGWIEPSAYDYESFAQHGATASAMWAGGAARYEWQDDFGDIAPRDLQLEEELFNGNNSSSAGDHIHNLNNVPPVYAESTNKVDPIDSWEDAGLHPTVLENIALCKWEAPTIIQRCTIPAITQNKDLIAVAHTGSGKTGAYLIPICSKLMGKKKKWAAPRPRPGSGDERLQRVTAEPLVLILVPTRELATQIFDETRRLCYRSMLRPCVAYGGAPIRMQREDLQMGCDLLIGTTGRILDFMSQPHVLSFKRIKFVVLDEADEMLHSDWQEDVRRIISGGDMNEDADKRILLFSATFSKACREVACEYLDLDYIGISIGRPGSSHVNVKQQIFYAEREMKDKALYDLILSCHPARTLCFVGSKAGVDHVDDFLFHMGIPVTSIHGDRTQLEREDAIRSFRDAKSPVMVATGLSARGLDIPRIMHVINYDLPRTEHGGITEYIHRIGRTARIGNLGVASSFYNEYDEEIASNLVKVLLENKEPIPDFLEVFRPKGDKLVFESDDEEPNSGSDTENGGSNDGDEQAASWDDEDSTWDDKPPATKSKNDDDW